MIKSVARQYHWPPDKIESLYVDDTDFFGLEYWYNDALEIEKEIRNNK